MKKRLLSPVEQQEGVTRTAFKYMSFDVAMGTIINSWLRVSRLHSLNDPFEWSVKADSEKEREPLEKNFDRIFKAFDSRCGILCFSSVPDSMLMWSHYADAHRGIVLELEVSGLQEVVYSEPPTIGKVAASLRNPTWGMPSDNSMFYLRKRQDWSYEKEWFNTV